MQTIETAVSVNADGSAVIQLQVPRNVPAGVHRAVVIVDEQTSAAQAGAIPDLLPLEFAGWPADCSFRREDLYGDDGR
ncbi:MAG: hypothetical protein ABFC96_11920 [Thermoguttaceae bacterium]